MVDFEKLGRKKKRPKPIDPSEIFRRLPKPPGINDLYTSQAEVLNTWFERREERDTVVKLHTGGGKTLVGMLMAQSTLHETNQPVLYLVPTLQLVNQAIEKARALGIPAVEYQRGQPLNDYFINAKAIMVATYKALFNGRSKFGIRGEGQPIGVSCIILDDAHVAFSVVRDSFTLEVKADEEERERYERLVELFRYSFRENDRLGTFDDTISGINYGVLEVPYWAWHEQLDAVREQIKSDIDKYELVWPLLRDQLHLCHALISRNAFTITPILPLVNSFPTFSEAPRRIYMSATIADDSEIIRTFDADAYVASRALTSKSLAGVSERMILIPDLMPFPFEVQPAIESLVAWTSRKNLGAVILVPSNRAAEEWSENASVAEGSAEVERFVGELQAGTSFGPMVFANRYDGIDLPGDSCRLLVLYGLPKGTSDYELFKASALYGGNTITRMLAQRIEQGIGRGARGSGDHCVVLLAGTDLAAWIAKDANFRFLTSATRAQLEIGAEISREVKDRRDLAGTIKRSFQRDGEWTEYHAESLAELVGEESADDLLFKVAVGERKALKLWQDGYHENAIAKIEKMLEELKDLDLQSRGWMNQIAARIADKWGNSELAQDLQRQAYSDNRNLLRPKVCPPYRPLRLPGDQEHAIVSQIGEYHIRRGFLKKFDEAASYLHHRASSNQFEQALADLAVMIGLASERHDTNGEGPDVLWILPTRVGIVIEAKSRKKEKNALTKEEHGQLLVAAEWFEENYEGYKCVRVSVHPRNRATKAAGAGASHALTYEKLASLVSDARVLLTALCESQLPNQELVGECSRLLTNSSLSAERLIECYLMPFEQSQ